MAARTTKLLPMRDRLIDGLTHEIDHVILTGHPTNRLPHHASVCVEYVEGESMLLFLASRGVAAASGSTCTLEGAESLARADGHRPGGGHRAGIAGVYPGRRQHAGRRRLRARSLPADRRAPAGHVAYLSGQRRLNSLRHEPRAIAIIQRSEIMATYSEKVMEHFMNPRNVGEIPDADGVGTVGNPVCGDMMAFYIKVDGDKLADVKFKTFGCGAAIAVSSMVSEMATGNDDRRGQEADQRRGRRRAGRAAAEQDALLQPGRGRAARCDRGLREEAPALSQNRRSTGHEPGE